MSIFKSEQRDERRFVSWLKGNLLGRTCPSYISIPGRHSGLLIRKVNPLSVPWTCELGQGHAGKHRAFVGTPEEIAWGYGDNWLEGC